MERPDDESAEKGVVAFAVDVVEQERRLREWNDFVRQKAAEREQAARESLLRRERESRERRQKMAAYKRLTGG